MKKKLSVLLALVMILSMSMTAFAAGSGSITIENATVGQKYSGYKIFDATWAGEAVSYTIDSEDSWYSLVSGAGSPFTLTQVGSSTTYNVGVADGKTDSDIIAWLQGQTPPGTAGLAEITATSATVKWDDVDYGYYLIDSGLGAIVTVTNVKEDVTIRDKNKHPGWENPTDPDDPNYGKTQPGKNVSSTGNMGDWGTTNTSSIDDTVYFKIGAFIPKYNGEMRVTEYIFTDTLGDGFTYNTDSLGVNINDNEATLGTDYTVAVDGQKITITIPMKDSYPTESSAVISYTAKADEDAVYDNMNKVEMTWKEYNPNGGDPDNPTNPDPYDPENPDKPGTTPPPTETHTYVYGFNLQKYAGEVGVDNKLTGAEFKLYDAAISGNEIAVVLDNGVYRVAVAGETGVVIPAGTAKIFGLAEGTYYLEEVTTPDGYNPLTARQEVVISAATANDDDGYLTSEVAVINLTGTVLPETGGIGTTIFYVVGGLMMFAAVILLVTKKKMSVK